MDADLDSRRGFARAAPPCVSPGDQLGRRAPVDKRARARTAPATLKRRFRDMELRWVFARPRSRVGRHSGTGDWAGSDVPEPAGRGLLGMGDDLAASQGRRVAHAPAAGSGSGRSSASGVRLDSPARPARGRGPDARSPLSPLVPTRPPPQPPSQPPSQPTQQHARRRHVPQAASSSAAGVRRGLASGSDEENADEADAPSRQPAAAKKKQRTPARPSGERHAICCGRLAAAQRLRRRELPLRGRRLVRHSLASPTTCAASAWTRSRTSRTTRSGCRRASRSACRSHARAACAQRCGRRRDGLRCTRVIVCVCITHVY